MPARSVVTICLAIVLVSASTFDIHADDKSLLIELDPRGSALPTALSASGAVIVGTLNDAIGAFYWMPTTGIIFAGGLSATGVSRDGHTIVGTSTDASLTKQAAIWTRGSEWRLLGSFGSNAAACDRSLSSAAGTNSNGQVVVGQAYSGCTFSHAFRWQESTGMVDLGSSVAGQPSSARGVSADGNVVVGTQTRADGVPQGARWVGGKQELIPGVTGFVGAALAANSDGSVVVGRICRFGIDADQSAWVWRAQGGTTCLAPPKRIPSPGPIIIGEATATSEDGQVVGGSQNVGGSVDSNAVIWLGGQPAYLKDFLRANGVPDAFQDWPNTGTITGISPDGRVLVGWGAAPAGFRGYIVILGSSRVIPS